MKLCFKKKITELENKKKTCRNLEESSLIVVLRHLILTGLTWLLFSASFQTGDRSGELTARMNVSDLQTVLGLSYSTNNSTLSENKEIDYNLHGKTPKITVLCFLKG